MIIYILKCEHRKYYIGKTNNLEKRISDHCDDEKYGSAWTQKYKPIEIMQMYKYDTKYDEDKYVLLYMELYGIENVRGGSYSSVELTDEQISYIKRLINHANDKCLRCGRDSHFISNCYAKTHIDGHLLKSNNRIDKPRIEDDFVIVDVCLRCGRDSHQKQSCYAKTHIDGYDL